MSGSKIYEVLDRLIVNGLVSKVVQNGILVFSASSPERTKLLKMLYNLKVGQGKMGREGFNKHVREFFPDVSRFELAYVTNLTNEVSSYVHEGLLPLETVEVLLNVLADKQNRITSPAIVMHLGGYLAERGRPMPLRKILIDLKARTMNNLFSNAIEDISVLYLRPLGELLIYQVGEKLLKPLGNTVVKLDVAKDGKYDLGRRKVLRPLVKELHILRQEIAKFNDILNDN